MSAGPKPQDVAGQRFGNTVAVRRELRPVGAQRIGRWLCRCDCGAEHWAALSALKSGRVGRCETCARPHKTRHEAALRGRKRWAEYRVWTTMKQRCLNPRNPKYKDYGGRGITIHPDWMWFDRFIADMGRRPSDRHSVERRDNDGPYSKDNCFWATPDVQAKNRRSRVQMDVGAYVLGQML